MIKSPFNYIGGKYRLLPQILPLFPKNIRICADVFIGGGNVGINIPTSKLILNDNLTYLTHLYQFLKQTSLSQTLNYIENRIAILSLSQTNQAAYLQLRCEYNQTKHLLDLFVFTAFALNHQIRLNNAHEFKPFGKKRSSFNERMKNNLIDSVQALQMRDVTISNLSLLLCFATSLYILLNKITSLPTIPNFRIIRTVVLYGSDLGDNQMLAIKIGFLSNEQGKMILGIQAPELFNEAICNLLDYWIIGKTFSGSLKTHTP